MTRTATFSDRIKEYRVFNNLTLAEMELRTGVPAQTLNRYELGQRVPKIDTAIEIADILDINPLWLQGYNVDIKRPVPMEENGPSDQEFIDLWKSLSPEDVLRAKDFALGLIASHKKPNDQNK